MPRRAQDLPGDPAQSRRPRGSPGIRGARAGSTKPAAPGMTEAQGAPPGPRHNSEMHSASAFAVLWQG
jgi:hypothetical protein